MSDRPKGRLIIIGGAEDLDNGRAILEEVARSAREQNGRLVLVTAATKYPEKAIEGYRKDFGELGIEAFDVLDVRTRDDACREDNVAKIEEAAVVFFTGGDQLRITSQIGDTPVYQRLQERFHEGITIAGTSAGAAAMPCTMIIGGPSDESGEVGELEMAPGLGLLDGVIIDSHFAERGRIGRLLNAIARNPREIGLGIDEATAIIVEGGEHFRVMGEGAVYIIDGQEISYSSLSEDNPGGIVTIFDVKVHVLGKGDCFDLIDRQPVPIDEPKEEA